MTSIANPLSASAPARASVSKQSPSLQLQEAILQQDPYRIDSLPAEQVNTALPNGELPLHFAIRRDSRDLIERLLAHPQINLNQKDDQGLTALDHLFLTNDPELQKFTLSLIYKKTVNDLPALSQFRIDAILDQIGSRLKHHRGMTPLHVAALGSKENAVKQLLEDEKQPQLLTSLRVSPLHLAALGKNTNIIELLINHGLDPNAADDLGFTPLHYASLQEDLTMARFLMEKGANPFIETAAVTPLALLVNLAKQRSREKDPLKVSLFQSFLCAFSVATWVHSYSQYNNPELASDLQTASSILFSFIIAEHCIKLYKKLDDIDALTAAGIALSLPIYDNIPILGEASLLLRTFFAGRAIWQGLQAGWRNRHLDPKRALQSMAIQSTNATASLWNLYQKANGIWNNHKLQAEVEKHLAQKNCSKALDTASKMNSYLFRDDTMRRIVSQCFKTDLETAKKAVLYITNRFDLELARYQIAQQQLSRGHCEDAFQTTLAIPHSVSQDDLLRAIALDPICRKETPQIATRAAASMNHRSNQDEVLNFLVRHHLNQSDCSEAYLVASKMNNQSNQDEALRNIALDSTCLQQKPELALLAAASINYHSNKDAVLDSLVRHHLNQGRCEEALRPALGMNYPSNQDNTLRNIALDPTCIKKEPLIALLAARHMNHDGNKDAALASLVTQHLDQGRCEEAMEAANYQLPTHQYFTLLKIANDEKCLKNHPDIAK